MATQMVEHVGETDEFVPEPRVFVVDDDTVLNDSLRFLIESVGLPVQAFGTIGDFLANFQHTTPGCVLLDLQLPDGTGMDALREIRERNVAIPVLIITAHARVPKVVDAMKLGAVDFLEKPVDHVALLRKVQEAVEADVRDWPTQRELARIRERLDTLTRREQEVLELVIEGHSSKEIGARLGVKEKTIEAHRANLARKVGAQNVSQLVNMVLSARGTDVASGS